MVMVSILFVLRESSISLVLWLIREWVFLIGFGMLVVLMSLVMFGLRIVVLVFVVWRRVGLEVFMMMGMFVLCLILISRGSSVFGVLGGRLLEMMSMFVVVSCFMILLISVVYLRLVGFVLCLLMIVVFLSV